VRRSCVPSSIADILRGLEPKRQEIERLERDFAELIKKYDVRAKKKNYSQELSTAVAKKLAEDLRSSFAGIEAGELEAGSAKGRQRVDVVFRTKLGLGLGVSIKTYNFVDHSSKRYTKNAQRVDKELRSEAADLHGYQPRAVLAGLVLLPDAARADGRGKKSSLEHFLAICRTRTGRTRTDSEHDQFELLFVGTYGLGRDGFGTRELHDAAEYRSGAGLPRSLDWEDFLEAVRVAYEDRNKVRLRR
jgi:hypothetical protein